MLGRLAISVLLTISFLAAGSPASAATDYVVRMSDVQGAGLSTDCGTGSLADHTAPGMAGTTVIIAQEAGAGSTYLRATGAQLNLNMVGFNTTWTRKYDAGHGLGINFTGCWGVTPSYPGDLFLIWEGSSLRFVWHFEYYGAPGSDPKEHFVIEASRIPFPQWKPGRSVAGWVKGTFPIKYDLREGTKGSQTTIGSASVLFYLSIAAR